MNANANYTTTRKVSYIESNGTKVMERTETEVNQIMKGTYEVAAWAAARAELALGQAEAVVAQVRAAEPPVRLARTGSYTVTWQEWHGTAVTPRNATGRDGRVRDLSRRTPIAESDRRSPGFSAVGMLPAEGLPPQDGWRTRTAVEQSLAQREAVAADLGVNQALHQEVLARVRDPGDAPWAAWLLAGPGTPVLPPSLLTP
jgi:hypothetical protein